MDRSSTIPQSHSNSPNEAFVLLANGTKGPAAIGLLQQVLESPSIFVFGELLDHPNIVALETSESEEAKKHFKLLQLFAFGTYSQYLGERDSYPPLTPLMERKLKLLSLAAMATETRTLKYPKLLEALNLTNVRELEDLIIEGTYANVVQGKLDQRVEQFEVDFAMARDIQQSEIKKIVNSLEDWCSSCDAMLKCLESEATSANNAKMKHIQHKADIEAKVADIRAQLVKSQGADGFEDPDSRMDFDPRVDRREYKKSGKIKSGLRGSSGKSGFWPK